ncbi:DUF1835 domain-containing protein [Niabella drilacis]|uniref:DUF1835 domain-containing protein n=1 Tax=Niabella drilacis (strain DSM 25811 / CCM 8410 / CCUG 62505 / LMG 26954 / E90) TaxID=1285928 RepID=A0A1G6JEN7_NIADE|nr:DUF1835 domain-containing protein [Niabella drilacis]SDC17113.1 Protein of unknown function [Niabella drilacis]
MIHIVFNQVEVDLMQQVMALDETLQGPVVQIRDDFAVGPLSGLDTEEGWQTRLDWWRGLSKGAPYPEDQVGSFDDRKTVAALKAQLTAEPGEQIWIWMGQNQHDVTGYYWLIPQLKEFQGRVMVLYLNNLPFINEKGLIFYPSWLWEIRPAEFLKAKRLARPVTLSEFEIDPDEWNKLVQENSLVRLLEGGKKIAGKEVTFYDDEILKNLTGEWQKATRVLSNTLNRMKIKTGDIFIMWRLKELVAAGKIQAEGDIDKDWKSFDVRLAGKKETAAELAADAGS